jgi:dihydroxyacetone kinase
MLSTKEFASKKGKSRPLGDRSIGYQDAGATSFYLMLKSMNQSISKILRERRKVKKILNDPKKAVDESFEGFICSNKKVKQVRKLYGSCKDRCTCQRESRHSHRRRLGT